MQSLFTPLNYNKAYSKKEGNRIILYLLCTIKLKGGYIMKKFTILLLSLICLSFNMLIATPVDAATTLKEGVYKVDDLNFHQIMFILLKILPLQDSIIIFVFDNNKLYNNLYD